MDILCAKCGRHFSSIEAVREHKRYCKHILQNENYNWIPKMVPNPDKLATPQELEIITKLFNTQNISPKSNITPEEWKKLLESANLQNGTIHNMQPPEVVNKKVELRSILALIITFSIIGGVLFLLFKSLLSSQ